MLGKIDWPAVSAVAAAAFSAVAASAAWAAVSQTRRERREEVTWRREEETRRLDQTLVSLHGAIVKVADTLHPGSSHRDRFRAQMEVRALAQVQHKFPLPKTAHLAEAPIGAITSAMTMEAMGEVEAARAELWTREGRGERIPGTGLS